MKREYDLSKKLMDRVSVMTMSMLVGCGFFSMSACVYVPQDARPNRPVHDRASRNLEASQFNQEFAVAVTEADVVIVREHSHASDLDSSRLNVRTKLPKYTYIKKELNFNDRMTFVEDVKGLQGRARNITTDCLFVPHHSIELYTDGKLSSVMEICYNCGEIKWGGSKAKASGDMFDAVTPLLERCGMKVHRDWHTKAEDKFVEGAVDTSDDTLNQEPEKPEPLLPGQVPTAKWVTGQEGKKVINPFTGETVDVEDIPAGIKVRDPNDKNEANIFRVPAL